MKNLIIFVALIAFATSSFAANYTLKPAQVQKVSGGLCALFNGKSWKPAAKVRGKKNTYKSIAGSSSLKRTCKEFYVAKTKLKLSDFPGADGLVAAGASASSIGVSSVSGTPPTISEIASTGAATYFWQDGVLSGIIGGSPTDDQCIQLFSSNTDGQSAGFPGCYMTQETAYVTGNIIQAGNTLCYMKNFPTREVQDGGGFTVASGSLPAGGITQLFAAPASTPRFVKINISSGQNTQIGVIKIYSQAQNAANGDQYRYDMIFCHGDDASPTEFEKTRVTLAGEFIARSSSSFGGQDESSGHGEGVVRAFLTRVDGDLVFNPELARSAVFTGVNTGFSYKSSMTLVGDEVTNKVYSVEGGGTRKGYGVSHIDGTGAGSLRFLEGAYKEENLAFGSFATAIEYRDSKYVAAPSNSYAERLSEVDFGTDSFYDSAPALSDSSAPFACNHAVSVEIALDMQSTVMQAVQELCEGERLDGMNFCSDDSIQQAANQYGAVCHLGTPD